MCSIKLITNAKLQYIDNILMSYMVKRTVQCDVRPVSAEDLELRCAALIMVQLEGECSVTQIPVYP
jgi:hypothetical protein